MLYCVILCYTVLYSMLYCAMLYVILCFTVCYTVILYVILCYTVLNCLLYCAMLSVILCFTVCYTVILYVIMCSETPEHGGEGSSAPTSLQERAQGGQNSFLMLSSDVIFFKFLLKFVLLSASEYHVINCYACYIFKTICLSN